MTDANGTNNNLDGTPRSDSPSPRPATRYIAPTAPTNDAFTNRPLSNQPLNNQPLSNQPLNNQPVTTTSQTSPVNAPPATDSSPSRPSSNWVRSQTEPSTVDKIIGKTDIKIDSRTTSRSVEKGNRAPRRTRRDRRRPERSGERGGDRSKAPRTASTKPVSRKLKIAGSPEPQSRTIQSRDSGGKSAKSKAIPLTSAAKATAKSTPTKRPAPTAASLARRRKARKKFELSKPLIRLIQLVVGGLGIATIAGTILTMRINADGPSAARTESVLATDTEPVVTSFPITLNQELASLKAELEELPNTYPGLKPKTFYIDVDTGNYASAGGQDEIAAASTIKLPILLAFFEEIDAGRMDLNQTMAIAPEQIAEGSGEMQLSPPGTQFTALEVATQMIVGSDNTATNMMIDLMGGAEKLNERFTNYGLEQTQLTSPLPDLTGTNTTSARDLAHTMLLISQGDSLTMRSRDRILNILNRTYNKSLIPVGLEEKGALTYNKTGDIESVLGDVSLVDVSNGKRYVIATLVERPTNDRRAVEIIHRISERTYQEAEKAIQPAVSPLGDPSGPPAAGTANGTAPSGTEATPSSQEGDSSGVVVEPNPNASDGAN